MCLKSMSIAALTAVGLMVMPTPPASAVEVGWQKLIDETVGPYHETDPRNVGNCEKIDKDCDQTAVETPGRCGSENVTAEFYCAGPWRSYEGLWGIGSAYLFLSQYGANMPQVTPKARKGWAAWQWEVETSGRYRVEIFYRPTDNRSPDADYYVLQLNSLGDMDSHKILYNTVVNQTFHGPLKSQGWHTLGTFEHQRGKVAAVGLWAHDDYYSDEADAVRWTLVEKIDDANIGPAINQLLLDR